MLSTSDSVLLMVATLAKALEPLAVGHGAIHNAGVYRYSFGWAAVVIEMLKLVACSCALVLQIHCCDYTAKERAQLMRVDIGQFSRLAIPGFLLALTNWGMFASLALLEPLLYQIVIKAVIVIGTALLGCLLLPRNREDI